MAEVKKPLEKIRWWLIIVLFVIGAALVVGAFVAEGRGWTGMAPAAFLQFGASVSLVGVLFMAERHFVRVIRAETLKIEERLGARADDLESRMDRLAEATDARLRKEYHRQEQAWSVLDDEVSFDSVTRALEEANEINALCGGVIDVRATDDDDGLRVEFSWGADTSAEEPVDRLMVRAVNVRADRGGGTPIVEVEWTPDMTAAAAGEAFTRALQRDGVYDGPKSFNWPTSLQGFRDSVEVAIRGRRHAEGDRPYLHGELITTRGNWIFTTAGIEHLEQGLVVSEHDFPAPYGSPNVIQGPKPSFQPECPTWVSEDEWQRVIKLGITYYPRRSLIAALLSAGGWVPRRHADRQDDN